MLHLRPSDYRVMPWKDGGGTTTEIAIEPAGTSLADPFLWRLSSARVESSGPFSAFPGYVRTLALLEGAGLILDGADEGRLRLKHFEKPVTFSGDAAVLAVLIQGPCQDLGLIADPRRIAYEVRPLMLGPDAISYAPAPTTLLVAPKGGVHVDPLGVRLGAMETLRLDAEAPARLGLRAEARDTPLIAVEIRTL